MTDDYRRRFRIEPGAYMDGDSSWALVDLGFGVYSHHELRLLGLNAPERSSPDGPRATAAHAGWYDAHAPHRPDVPGWPFDLHSLARDTEKYGRYLAMVTCGRGHSLNAFMLTIPGVVPMAREGMTGR